ncbi:MAG: aldo/keto reductase [Janthinobacterium lividum]
MAEPDRGPRVQWHGIEQELSPLGFGTSALMSRVNRRDSARLLQTALDAGITHFDTARSYGFGEAEMAVGDLLAGRRDRVTVTTKVGILPPRRSAGLAAAKAVARGLLRVLPGMRDQLRRRAGGLVQAERFDTASMTDSLHTSLRQLRTDYVDFLLLHEPSFAVLATTEALSFLERVQREGKVRNFGIAATPEVAEIALEQAAEYTSVLQLSHGVFTPNLQSLRRGPPGVVFTHSALGTRFGALQAQLKQDARLRAQWTEALRVDLGEPGSLVGLALQYARVALPRVVVLFTSTQPAHVLQNAAALKPVISAEELKKFEALVQEWSAMDGGRLKRAGS